MCRSVQAAHTDVQVGTGGIHRCAGLYSRHTLHDNNGINKRHPLLIKRPGDKQTKCVLLHINGWVTVVRKWLSDDDDDDDDGYSKHSWQRKTCKN
jgi:hypothetical protein